jgi:predicted nucleic acid-binding protein
MSDKYFIDTNILIYMYDVAAGAKHKRAKELIEELRRNRSGVVSTQVLQDLCVNLRRKAAKPESLVRIPGLFPTISDEVNRQASLTIAHGGLDDDFNVPPQVCKTTEEPTL